ncbi:hypothetical protein EBU99_13140 [bacterium]|nr:hypothetical protein [bacterium]
MFRFFIAFVFAVGLTAVSGAARAEAPSLRIPGQVVGSRPASLGGAFTAVADDQNALFYNPAGLARLDSTFFSLSDFELSASLGSGGIGDLVDDVNKVSDAAKSVASESDTSKQIDNITKLGELVSSRTAFAAFKDQLYLARKHWGFAGTVNLATGLGIHSKLLPEVADLALLGDLDARFGYAHSFLDDKLSVGLAPYYKMRAQGGRANLSLSEGLDPANSLSNIVGIGQGFGVDFGLMVTPIEAMSPTFGLAILNLGDTRFRSTGSSAFSNLGAFKGASVLGTPDPIKQIVNAGFSIAPVDGPGLVRLSAELREINRPSAAALRPAFGIEGGFRSRFVRALVDAGWGNGNWSAGFELRALIKLRFASYIEPNLFFDRKDNQRVWVLSFGI